jgi:release factor glutamine methyltransferase
MLDTPDTAHVNFNRIYEPAEDSFFLLDTLSSPSETAFLQNRFLNSTNSSSNSTNGAQDSILLVEAGPGSGVVLAFLTAHATEIFGDGKRVASLGVDVNEYACQATAHTVEKARRAKRSSSKGERVPAVFMDAVNGDLLTCLRSNSIDVLIFNPPYVPTEETPVGIRQSLNSSLSSFETDSKLLALSYAGGPDGMETTDRLLLDVPRALKAHRGIAYVLLCARNKPTEVMSIVNTSWGNGWTAELAAERKAGWERLFIVRIWQKE